MHALVQDSDRSGNFSSGREELGTKIPEKRGTKSQNDNFNKFSRPEEDELKSYIQNDTCSKRRLSMHEDVLCLCSTCPEIDQLYSNVHI